MVTAFKDLLGPLVVGFLQFAAYYFLAVNVLQIFIIFVAWVSLSRRPVHMHRHLYTNLVKSKFLPAISTILPAYNEEKTVVTSTKFLLLTDYPNHEIIVVNDGSSDKTLGKLIEAFQLQKVPPSIKPGIPTAKVRGIYRSTFYQNLTVIDKENGGKADALNTGINIANFEFICAIDADSMLEEDALIKVMRPILQDPEKTVATGGVVRLADGARMKVGRVEAVQTPDSLLSLAQVIEYLRAFLFGRVGFASMKSLLIIAGAFGLFRKDVLKTIGGYSDRHIGEDMELVTRMHRKLHEWHIPFQIPFVPDPVCWTHGPQSIKELKSQRIRWHKGLLQTLQTHKKMFMNPRYGFTGLVAYPYYLLFEVLGPVLEVMAYIALPVAAILGQLNWPIITSLFAIMILFTSSVSLLALCLEQLMLPRFVRVKDILRIMYGSVIEVFTYRPLNHWWKTRAFFSYMLGAQSWIERDEHHRPIVSVWDEEGAREPKPRKRKEKNRRPRAD